MVDIEVVQAVFLFRRLSSRDASFLARFDSSGSTRAVFGTIGIRSPKIKRKAGDFVSKALFSELKLFFETSIDIQKVFSLSAHC